MYPDFFSEDLSRQKEKDKESLWKRQRIAMEKAKNRCGKGKESLCFVRLNSLWTLSVKILSANVLFCPQKSSAFIMRSAIWKLWYQVLYPRYCQTQQVCARWQGTSAPCKQIPGALFMHVKSHETWQWTGITHPHGIYMGCMGLCWSTELPA